MTNKLKNMARIKILLLMPVLIIGMVSCFTGKKVIEPVTTVFPFSDTTTLRNGTLIYALPRTILTVKVDMERIIEIPGGERMRKPLLII